MAKFYKMRWIVIVVLLLFCSCADERPFRLHVIANSDSAADQTVKLKVRDAVLEYTGAGMMQCKNAQEAEEYARLQAEGIAQTAKRVLEEEGFDYDAQVVVGKSYFPEKTYGEITYPAGEYEAVRVILGEGAGQNWWCVLFPPLCLISLEEDANTTCRDGQTEVRFESVFSQWFAQKNG